MKCEACNDEAQCILYLFGERPYHLCMSCHVDLTLNNMSPSQISNLLANGHDEREFMIQGEYNRVTKEKLKMYEDVVDMFEKRGKENEVIKIEYRYV